MSGAARWIAVILGATGFLLLGYCGMALLDSRLAQTEGTLKLNRLLQQHAEIHAPAAPPVYRPSHGDLIGKVDIPRLKLSAVVFEGTDDVVLNRGVGHLTGSALPLPGQSSGNVVLAAHRDSFFRDLRNIRQGDIVDVTTEFGARRYEVESTEIVNPTDVSVEAPTRDSTLTLITCYPFYYVGHAPKRFIVRAEDQAELSARGNGVVKPASAASVEDPNKAPAYVSYAVFADSSPNAGLN
jgi:sortase A